MLYLMTGQYILNEQIWPGKCHPLKENTGTGLKGGRNILDIMPVRNHKNFDLH